jgi:hypothetical protein
MDLPASKLVTSAKSKLPKSTMAVSSKTHDKKGHHGKKKSASDKSNDHSHSKKQHGSRSRSGKSHDAVRDDGLQDRAKHKHQLEREKKQRGHSGHSHGHSRERSSDSKSHHNDKHHHRDSPRPMSSHHGTEHKQQTRAAATVEVKRSSAVGSSSAGAGLGTAQLRRREPEGIIDETAIARRASEKQHLDDAELAILPLAVFKSVRLPSNSTDYIDKTGLLVTDATITVPKSNKRGNWAVELRACVCWQTVDDDTATVGSKTEVGFEIVRVLRSSVSGAAGRQQSTIEIKFDSVDSAWSESQGVVVPGSRTTQLTFVDSELPTSEFAETPVEYQLRMCTTQDGVVARFKGESVASLSLACILTAEADVLS